MTVRLITLFLTEHVLIVLAVIMAAALLFGVSPSQLIRHDWTLPLRGMLIASVLQLCLHYSDLYDSRTRRKGPELISRVLVALVATALILAPIYYWIPALMIGRAVFLLAAGLMFVAVVTWRLLFEWLLARVGPGERLLFVGTSAAAVDLARELFERRHELGAEIVGFVDTDPNKVGSAVINHVVIGGVDAIPALVRQHKVDRVVVSLADSRGKLEMARLLEMKLKGGVRFDHLATVYERYTGKIAVENLRPSWFIFSDELKPRPIFTVVKRVLDVFIATALLIVTTPVMALVAVAIRLSSSGPVLYRQRRVGRDGRLFTLSKFRSMGADAEARTGAVWAQKDDPRILPIGRFMRKTRLDELPQLLNVLRGEMSLIGPRPERPEFVEGLSVSLPFYGQRHVIRPGLTGWAQVRYSYGASERDALEKLQYDLFYVKHMSPWLDALIIFETVKTVVLRRGA